MKGILQTARLSAAGVVLGVLGAAGIVTAQNARQASVRIQQAVQDGARESAIAVPRHVVQKKPAPAADEVPPPDNPQNDAPAPARADEALRYAFDVRLSSDGMVVGRLQTVIPTTGGLRAAQRAGIRFERDANLISDAKPDIGGVFQASGMSPGVYSMIAEGEEGFLAVGIRVLGSSNVGDEKGQIVAIDADSFTTILVPAVDVPVAYELIRSHAPIQPTVQPAVAPPPARNSYPYRYGAPGAPVLRPGLGGYSGRTQGVRQPYSVSPIADVRPGVAAENIADVGFEFPKTPVREYHARLTADGHLTGRVQVLDSRSALPVPVTSGEVLIVQNGRAIGGAAINSRGMFDVAGMAAGPVSFVAVAPEGFVACTIIIGNPPRPAKAAPVKAVSATREVALQANGDPAVLSLDCAVVPYSSFLQMAGPIEEGMMMAPCCGMTGGGGGGAGGGGLGWLGLAGLAGLAGLGNHGSNTTVVTTTPNVASPAHP